MSSSRVTYVVLVDAGSSTSLPPFRSGALPLLPSDSNRTAHVVPSRAWFAALTFLLFTSIFHHHLTTYTHLLSTSFLCQSFSALLPPPSSLPPPAAHLCSLASTALGATPSPLARFLLVNPHPEGLSLAAAGGGAGFARAAEMVRELRNWRVGLVVLLKAALVAAALGALTAPTATAARRVRSRRRPHEEKGCCLLPTSSALLVASSSCCGEAAASPFPPPAYGDAEFQGGEGGDAEGGDGDDTPWIALALSLLVHLSIALLDRGAAGAVRATLERTELKWGAHAWAVIAAGAGVAGCGTAWAWKTLRRGRVQLQARENGRCVVVSL
ncbi:hypothetical protein JCM21900_005015 [Sporobolomyces salmonicolor]